MLDLGALIRIILLLVKYKSLWVRGQKPWWKSNFSSTEHRVMSQNIICVEHKWFELSTFYKSLLKKRLSRSSSKYK
jgi:hypothetical protein